MKKKVTIYTDGACSGNPGPGGWGAYILYGNHSKKIYGSEYNTTNNRMELTAAIEAIKVLKHKCTIDLYTDSVYLKNGITTWIHNWIKKDWRISDKSLVKNMDLWQTLEKLSKEHEIEWHWVKGHANNFGNTVADELAVRGRDEAKNLKNGAQ
jgi:ribonuclease HI